MRDGKRNCLNSQKCEFRCRHCRPCFYLSISRRGLHNFAAASSADTTNDEESVSLVQCLLLRFRWHYLECCSRTTRIVESHSRWADALSQKSVLEDWGSRLHGWSATGGTAIFQPVHGRRTLTPACLLRMDTRAWIRFFLMMDIKLY